LALVICSLDPPAAEHVPQELTVQGHVTGYGRSVCGSMVAQGPICGIWRVEFGMPSAQSMLRSAKRKTMFDTVTKIIKWGSIPVLLMVSLFSRFAAQYELLANVVICMGAIGCVQRAVRQKRHGWAVAFVAVVIVFSPLALAAKIFLLMG